jgi:hypothetical protein
VHRRTVDECPVSAAEVADNETCIAEAEVEMSAGRAGIADYEPVAGATDVE